MINLIEMYFNYLKSTIRNLFRNKLFTIINVSGFSIGLALFSLTFLWIIYEFSYDKFHKNSERIYRVATEFTENGSPDKFAHTPAPLGPAMKEQIPGVLDYVRCAQSGKELVAYNNNQFWEDLFYADPSIFEIFDFNLKTGNPNDVLSSTNNIVLSEQMVDKYFSDHDVIGKSLTIGSYLGETYTITGILENTPLNSQIKIDFLVPFSSITNNLSWNNWNYTTYILLDESNNIASLQNNLATFQKNNNIDSDTRLLLQPLTEIHLFSNLRSDLASNTHISKLLTYASIALIILFLASINFINLSLAKSTLRNTEIGVRKVIGASKSQIKWQFLSESTIITFTSFLLSIPIIYIILPFFTELTDKDFILNQLFNYKSIFLVFCLMALLGIINGVYPANILSSYNTASILNGLSRNNQKSPIHIKKVLIVIQFVIAIFFISSTILLKSQLHFIKTKDLGFDKDNTIIIPIFYEEVRKKSDLLGQEIKKHASVKDISFTSYLPTNRRYYQNVWWEGMEENRHEYLSWIAVDPNFINLMGINIKQGRNFSKNHKSDNHAYILNEKALQKFGWKNPIGKFMDITEKGEVIGIVEDFHFRSLHNKIEPVALKIFPDVCNYLYIKASSNSPSEVLSDIEDTWAELFPNRPFEYTFLNSNLDEVYKRENKESKISNFLGLLSILIAALGILGISSLIVTKRTKEIGIRKVNGAKIFEILSLLNSDFIKWVILAFILTCPIAWYAMAKWLQNFAYKTEISWWIFALAGAIALVIALFTVSWQSWRAACRNPVEALRYE